MTSTPDGPPASAPAESAPAPATTPARGPGPIAGLASLGAGAIHAAAIGVHSEHRGAVWAFTVVASLQLAWGAAVLARPRAAGRALALAGVGLGVAALGGWFLAKTSGIGFVAGMEERESVQLADGAAAALAAVATVLAIRALVASALPAATVGRRAPRVPAGAGLALLATPVAALTVAAMVSAGSHSHAGSHGDGTAHAHGAAEDHHGDGGQAASDGHADGGHGERDHGDHGPAPAVPPTRYDPTKPVNLSGVPGVTLEQQAAAENLVVLTLARLPQFADVAEAEARGYRSIGDGFTGHEHFVNWEYLSDGRQLDPDFPESLVYDTSGPERRLVSAMFMAEPDVTLETVPEVGGPLTQWHVHDDLCFTTGDNPRVVGLTSVDAECEPPLEKLGAVPMIHVWIEPHPCGPFAALEGVAAGQVREGEEHLCDHAHGSG